MTDVSTKTLALAAIDEIIGDMAAHQSSERGFLSQLKSDIEQSDLTPQDTIVLKLATLQAMSEDEYRQQVNFNIIYAEPLLIECIERINAKPTRFVSYMLKVAGEEALPALKHFAGNRLTELFQVVAAHIDRVKQAIHDDGMSAYFCDHSATSSREYADIARRTEACNALSDRLANTREAYFMSISECLSRS